MKHFPDFAEPFSAHPVGLKQLVVEDAMDIFPPDLGEPNVCEFGDQACQKPRGQGYLALLHTPTCKSPILPFM